MVEIAVTPSIVLTKFQAEAIVGIILGDGSLERRKQTHNARLRLEQTFPVHTEYLCHLFAILINLCTITHWPNLVIRAPDIRTGKIYMSVTFKTRSLSSLTEFHNIFYPQNIKRVPPFIDKILTSPVSLAYWIMDDGSIDAYGATLLHTQGYSYYECTLLQATLYKNFNLKSGIIQDEDNNNQYFIKIYVRQQVPLCDIVGPYMHNSMMYKIGL